jgi:very-short-patch-repair endonuclease
LPLEDAVVAVDALARIGRFDPRVLLARRAEQSGARGVRGLDEVVGLADPRAESPPETRLRLMLRSAGLAVPEVQYRVEDEHGFVVTRVDLAYPEAKLAIEYDGSTHFDRGRALRDRDGDLELGDLGWDTMRFGSIDLETRPQTVRRVTRRLEARMSTLGPRK